MVDYDLSNGDTAYNVDKLFSYLKCRNTLCTIPPK